jgi:uncharacterized protein
MDYNRVRDYAIERLTHELARELTYHSIWHTCDDVVPAVERLAQRSGVVGDQLLLLRTAAYYHDIGFIEQRDGHEAAGVRIAQSILPQCGYTANDIAIVGAGIMATRLPQSPRTLLEQLLADADLDVLGRADFLQRNHALRTELAFYGADVSDAVWYRGQIQFLSQHRYWTTAAMELRNPGKQHNLIALQALLKEAS